jgi:hypothetical protein
VQIVEPPRRPEVERSGDPRLSSFRRYLRRHVDPVRRGFPKRMRRQIDLREQRHIGGPDRISKCILIATFAVSGGLQVDPVAMRADYPRSPFKPAIELLRSGRLPEIESLCAHLHSNLDFLSYDIAGEERACNHGRSTDRPGSHESFFGEHVISPCESTRIRMDEWTLRAPHLPSPEEVLNTD